MSDNPISAEGPLVVVDGDFGRIRCRHCGKVVHVAVGSADVAFRGTHRAALQAEVDYESKQHERCWLAKVAFK